MKSGIYFSGGLIPVIFVTVQTGGKQDKNSLTNELDICFCLVFPAREL